MSLSPLLKWAGGKTWLLPHLRRLCTATGATRIAEPFAGGLALSFDRLPRRAKINDVNRHLINLYLQVKHGTVEGLEELWCADQSHYYRQRARFNHLIETEAAYTPEGAALFLYLNQFGFNGLCRFNRQGTFNVPWGGERSPALPDLEAYARAMSGWYFTWRDFADVGVESDMLVYCDPPYEGGWTGYSARPWTFADFVRLAEWGTWRGVPVVISNVAQPHVIDVLVQHGYDLLYVDGPRRISRDGNRTPVREVLAVSGMHWPDSVKEVSLNAPTV